MLAIFEHPDDLVAAAKKIHHKGITKTDAFTPFPIHGLDEALGLKRSWIPWVTLAIGVGGAAFGFLFQAWALSIDWPVNIGGKPPIAWPSFIPVTFEVMVLTSGIMTTLTLFALCWPFRVLTPSLDRRLTDDRFGLFVDSSDEKFNETELNTIFQECHVQETKHI